MVIKLNKRVIKSSSFYLLFIYVCSLEIIIQLAIIFYCGQLSIFFFLKKKFRRPNERTKFKSLDLCGF